MTTRSWPSFIDPLEPDEIANAVLYMLGTREEDINDFANLPNEFVGGRKVDKIPTSSADYDAATDKIGDINYDTSYFYYLVSDGLGGAVWRRIASASW